MSTITGKAAERNVANAIKTLAGEPTGLTPGAAIALLADATATGGGAAAQSARTALADAAQRHVDPQVRVAATVGLGASDTDASRRVLRKLVAGADGQQAAAAARGLSRIGTKADIAKMRSGVTASGWLPAHRAAETAAVVLAHRVGATEPGPIEIPSVADGAGGRGVARQPRLPLPRPRRAVDVVKIPVREVVRKVELAPRERVTLPAEAAVVGAFTCGPRQHVVMAPKHDAETLAKQPTVAGALLGVNETTGSSFVRWLVLTSPRRGGRNELDVSVTRPDGTVGFVGTGRTVDGGIEVTVVAVDAPGQSAVEVTASLIDGELKIGGVADPMVTVPRRTPAPAPAVPTP